VYGLFRFLDQMPGQQTFTDHLGRERTVAAPQRHQLAPYVPVGERVLLTNPKFRYTVSVWSLPSTEQTLGLRPDALTATRSRINFRRGRGAELDARSIQGLVAVLGRQ